MSEPWQNIYVRHVMAETNLAASALADLVDVSSSTLTRPLNNPNHKSKISLPTLQKIQDKTGIPYAPFVPAGGMVQILASGEAQALPGFESAIDDENADWIPVRDIRIGAGPGVIPDEYEPATYNLAFPPGYLAKVTKARPEHLQIATVKGDSMSPTLNDDDVVMFDITKTNIGFDGIFVVFHLEALKAKRLRLGLDKKTISLISDNPLTPDELCPIEDVRILGRVVWSGGKK